MSVAIQARVGPTGLPVIPGPCAASAGQRTIHWLLGLRGDATPMDRELVLETSHVPMLAAPDALAELLLDE
jgi:hypothetical protein